jgi:hypothetical protein
MFLLQWAAEATQPEERRFSMLVLQVWDYGGNGYVRYSAAAVGLPVMGYVAENRVIQAALGRRLRERSNTVDFVSPVRL